MFKDYSEYYENVKNQHNVMVLVGNGFDIGVLNQFQIDKYKGKTTKYSDFYNYITYYNLCSGDNELYKQMTEDKLQNISTWSDFEMTLDKLLKEGKCSYEQLENDLDEMQRCFSLFLRDIVSLEVTNSINDYARKEKLAITSLGRFLGDLSGRSKRLRFPEDTDHYDLYNFLFVNFNYTYLLDNYIYLDKNQFEPHKYKYADRNFNFYPNPKGILKNYAEDTVWSSYLVMDVIHPHGVQSVPRSMIFGTEYENYDKKTSEKRFIKSYWAQNDIKYASYFENVKLFIIYGMSMGKTDSWWLKKICQKLLDGAELIVYKHKNSKGINDIRKKILDCYSEKEILTSAKRKTIESNIYMVEFSDNDKIFLGLKKK